MSAAPASGNQVQEVKESVDDARQRLSRLESQLATVSGRVSFMFWLTVISLIVAVVLGLLRGLKLLNG